MRAVVTAVAAILAVGISVTLSAHEKKENALLIDRANEFASRAAKVRVIYVKLPWSNFQECTAATERSFSESSAFTQLMFGS